MCEGADLSAPPGHQTPGHQTPGPRTLIIYRGIVFDNLVRCNIIPYSSESLIIDKLKGIFCLESFEREVILMPSQECYILEHHRGFERHLTSEEMKEYEVFKIRLFRWLVGLSIQNPAKDILVRFHNGRRSFLSHREDKLDHSREFNLEIPAEINPTMAFQELLYGYTLEDLRKEIYKIVSEIDKDHLGMVNAICRKINQYNLMGGV